MRWPWKRRESNSTAEILRAAKARIDTPEKWGQGYNLLSTPKRCSTQAISTALGLDLMDYGVLDTAPYEVLAAVVGHDQVGNWNDAPERTHADVMAAFDRAIETCEAA